MTTCALHPIDGQCGQPATATAIVGCRHEHIDHVPVCPPCTILIRSWDGWIICDPCLHAGHHCPGQVHLLLLATTA